MHRLFMSIIFCVALTSIGVVAEEPASEPTSLNEVLVLSTGQFNGNRIASDMENNGMFVSHRISGHSGFEWPKGDETYAIYASGLWIAGQINGEIRTAVVEYGPEFVSGPYGSDGSNPADVLYKVNISDLDDPSSNPDFANWPIDQGAPWIDVDGDGIYTPMPAGSDHPEFIGDQVIFYVMNDGISAEHIIFGTEPLGIEVRMTIWGYDRSDMFGDMMFAQAEIINLGDHDIGNAYIGLWSDPDIGDMGDDFVGCDPTLSLGFAYNDGADDLYGMACPAVGYDFFQAAVPSRDGSGELIMTDEQWVGGEMTGGYKNLPMSSFIKYINGSYTYTDPNDAQEAYFYMQGYLRDGSPIINSATGEVSKFVHPDDPNDNIDENDNIWVDGDDNPASDRRFFMNVGPFNLLQGDKAQVVYGIMVARNETALHSVTELKRIDGFAQSLYESHFTSFSIPQVSYSANSINNTEMELIIEANLADFEGLNSCEIALHSQVGYPTLFTTVTLFDDGQHDDQLAGDHIWANSIIVVNTKYPHSADLTLHLDTGDEVFTNYFSNIRLRPLPSLENWQIIWENRRQDQLINNDETVHLQFDIYNNDLVNQIDELTIVKDGILELDSWLPAGGEIEIDSHFFIVTSPPTGDSVIFEYQLYFDHHFELVRTTLPVTYWEGDVPEIDVSHNGESDASISVSIVDPTLLTGAEYRVFFDEQHYYMDVDSNWWSIDFPDSIGMMAKPGDLTGTSVTGVCGLYGVEPGTINLIFTVDFVSDGAYADGWQIDLPDDLSVNNWTHLTGDGLWIGFDGTMTAGNVLTWGNNSQSGSGSIRGYVTVSINVDEVPLPISADYVIYDDGWSGVIVDAVGTTTISEIGYDFKTEKHWNLSNLTTGDTVLVDQTIINGVDYYTGENAGDPIVDGFLITLFGTYELPMTFSDITLIKTDGSEDAVDVDDYYHYGWAADAMSISILGFGSTDLGELGKDYECRWTGIYANEPIVINGINVWEVESGGSMASLFGVRGDELANHPLNPNPGVSEPFLVRIPFEVWNRDTGEQINFSIYDRSQYYDGSMDIYAFNPFDRMYTYFVNTPYDSINVIPADGGEHADHFTWNLVWWGDDDFENGDMLIVKYYGPILLADEFFFNTVTNFTNEENNQISDFRLFQNYPNPFNPITRIDYRVPKTSDVKITIFDITGREVKTLINRSQPAGLYQLQWNGISNTGKMLSTGVYFARLEAGRYTQVIKMVYLK